MRATSSGLPIRKKTVHVVAFDVSGSMHAPLNLRENAQDASAGSKDLESKRVGTVFDMLLRLAEDGAAASRNQEIYAAVLCFGLRAVPTCDLLALLEERVESFELMSAITVDADAPAGLPHSQLVALFASVGIRETEASSFLQRSTSINDDHSTTTPLYVVEHREPLIRLLEHNGAPHCRDYVQRHTTPATAGKYFTSFAVPERKKELDIVVQRLPSACKDNFSPSRYVSQGSQMAADQLGLAGAVSAWLVEKQEKAAADEAIKFADSLLSRRGDISAVLKRFPIAEPRQIDRIIRLMQRLQTVLNSKTSQTSQPQEQAMPKADISAAGIDWQHLLDEIEPYLYGATPMREALQSVRPIFQDNRYSTKSMMLISDGVSTDGDPIEPAKVLRDAGCLLFTCLLTNTVIAEPRRLLDPDEMPWKWAPWSWPTAEQHMFKMASTVSCDSSAVQILRRRGWQLPSTGRCKLFIRANDSVVIDEFATASRGLATSSDAILDLVGEISLDTYIQRTNRDAAVTHQLGRAICWAHATASVIHLASHRIIGRRIPDFYQIRSHLLSHFGDNDDGQNVSRVLRDICPSYKLRFQTCDEEAARFAIHARRPVIATFALDREHWDRVSVFYEDHPQESLTSKNMSGQAGGETIGHAVVLVRCDDTSLTFMNSWGTDFANKGFFTVDKSSTLEMKGGPRMNFYDVYWTVDDLSDDEKESWKVYGRNRVHDVLQSLSYGFRELPVECPGCKTSSPARQYQGSWDNALCTVCGKNFTPTVQALVQTLYNANYD